MTATIGGHDPTSLAKEGVGMTIVDDRDGLAPGLAEILRSAARQVSGAKEPRNDSRRSDGTWPFTVVRTVAGMPDGAGRPDRTDTTVMHGPFMTPTLIVTTQATDGVRLMRKDPTEYLLTIARLVEGGDGTPDDRDLRRVAVVSALCDRDPAYAEDMVVLHSATAFEPAYLYDEGFRGLDRMFSRILTVAAHMSSMVEALPRITRTTIVRNHRGVPVIGIAPVADKAVGQISDDDMELVGIRSHED